MKVSVLAGVKVKSGNGVGSASSIAQGSVITSKIKFVTAGVGESSLFDSMPNKFSIELSSKVPMDPVVYPCKTKIGVVSTMIESKQFCISEVSNSNYMINPT